VERGREVAGDPSRIIIIGDTPFDVEAAKAVGAESVGVATGRSSVADLKSCGADCCLESFTNPEALLEFL